MALNPTKPPKNRRQATLIESRNFAVNANGKSRQTKSPSSIPIVSNKVVNVASVPQRSPLRYPGGKTWLVPQIRNWLEGLTPRPTVFVEPFAGGAIASLTAVMEGFVERSVLCEKDPELSNLWYSIFEDAETLAQRVERFKPTFENVRTAFDNTSPDSLDAAFNTLLANRINRGGIIARGASKMNSGENGKGISSRWYANTIAERLRAIGRQASRFKFVHGDGIELIDHYKDCPEAVFFIDPPYTVAGKRAGSRLYNFNQIDHESLFEHMTAVRGPFMMTYDENPDVIEMATRQHFHLSRVAMKNTHHAVMYELLITSHELTS